MDKGLCLSLLGKQVLLRTTEGETLSGLLSAADAHLNLCVEDAVLLGADGAPLRELGARLLRGDAVAFVARRA